MYAEKIPVIALKENVLGLHSQYHNKIRESALQCGPHEQLMSNRNQMKNKIFSEYRTYIITEAHVT